MDAPRPRLESILGHCERHALLHMAPKWLDHWTTWAGQQNSKHISEPILSSDRITSLFVKHDQRSNASIFALLTHPAVYLLVHAVQMSVGSAEN